MKNWLLYIRGMTTPCTNSRGATAVEVGLTMLPFLITIFGVMEFGWYFLHLNTMTAATRDGIRIGALGSSHTDSENPGTSLSREDSIKKAIREKAETVMNIVPSKIFIFPLEDDFSNPDDIQGLAPNAGAAGKFMRVRVEYDHEFFTQLIGGFFQGNGTIPMVAEGTYRNEDFIL